MVYGFSLCYNLALAYTRGRQHTMTIGEHISGLIATIALVIIMGIVGELELRDIEHVQQQEQRQ